ncbi:hypothetical protein CFC21_077928 [Triticum aestivum]|nr:probable BRI1 kinase inhibitor 1 [Aegilops tauschii subsp. strangulata]XP_044401393.1 probable BRI1 kinase inhibitor 1 [Triticum aestivum]KAF7072847.1 hypothetical protein CFC21_077928 [Triticum aestivum]
MDAPRPRSPPPLFMPTTPPPAPPPPPPLSSSPSPDFSFSFPPFPPSPPPSHVHLRVLPLPAAADMSRTPLGRVGSDISHNNYAKANHRQATSHSSCSSDDRDRAKARASPFFPGLGGAWRPGEGRDDTAGKAEEDRKKVKGKRGPLEVGQRVKKYMASLVEQLLASFSRHGERDRRGQRRRPHTFSVNGPGAAATMERERWRQRRGHLSSAPASLRASPVNSGHLSVGGSLVKVSTSSEESTMEELQSAIQAAIAHCKNSIAVAKQ